MIPRYQQPDLGELKSRLDCRDLYQALVGTGKRSGKALVDRTPWREDRKPSLNIYADGWIDRATGERGDVFSLVQNIRGSSFSAAVEFVAGWLGVGDNPRTVPPARPRVLPSDAPNTPPSRSWQTGAQKAVSEAERYLWLNRPDSEAVRAYLRNERGLSDETIQRYRLGYNPAWRKIRVDDQAHYLPPGITIPWLVDVHLWSVKVRCRVGTLAQALGIPEDTDRDDQILAKYRQLAGGNQGGALFNGDALEPDKPVTFTEGELDAILGQQLVGDMAAFVTAGSASSSLTAPWRERVQAASAILLALDNDETGQKATERLTHVLSGQCRIAPLPAGKDLTDFVVKHSGNVRVWLEAALNKTPPIAKGWTSLPDTWRAAVNAYLPDNLSPFLERLAAVGWFVAGHAFTRPQALAELGLSRATVDRALEAGEDIFWKRITVLPPSNPSQKEQEESIGKTVITYGFLTLPEMATALLKRAACRIWERCNPVERGRPLGKPQAGFFIGLGYSVEEAEQIVVELEALLRLTYHRQGNAERFSERIARRDYDRLRRLLSDTTSTPLPAGWRYHNVHEYRACFARAIKQAEPERNFSLGEWSEKLGISVRSVVAVLERAGIASLAQYQEEEITSLDEVRQLGRKLKGYPKRLLVRTDDQHENECRYDPERLEGALRLGQRCTVRYQLANKQTIATDEQPERPIRKIVPAQRPVPSDVMTTPLPAEPQPKQKLPAAYCGSGYDPTYIRAWVTQACDLALGYVLRADGQLIDHETGEVLTHRPTDLQLVELLRGKAVAVGGEIIIDDLLGWITRELGGMVTSIEPTNPSGTA